MSWAKIKIMPFNPLNEIDKDEIQNLTDIRPFQFSHSLDDKLMRVLFCNL
jgi:hypothetical protein